MGLGTYLLIFIIIAAVVGIGIPLIGSILRAKDFRDQVSGKKPERKADPNRPMNYGDEQRRNRNLEIDSEVAKTKSFQNLMGPK